MTYSNKDFKKLGDRIRTNSQDISENDYRMLQQLRISYKESLSIVFNCLEKLAHKVDKDCVCTYRIKRIESIISKIKRFPEMQINRAEDIAGCRCILSTEEQVYKLYNAILKRKSKLPFEIKGKINDYIEYPKDSGYKSIHINVAVKGETKRIEIQLRCLKHHNWATLVEITDLLYNLKLKETGKGSNPELFQLHQLLSKDNKHLTSRDSLFIADIVIKHNYIFKLGDVFAQNYIDVRQHWNSLKLKQNHFFLISTGQDGKPEIFGFSNFDTAESEYYDKFTHNEYNKNIVLTHLRQTSFAKISVAYSNYFLTFNNTVILILSHLSKAVKYSFKKNKICSFDKYYQTFLDIMMFWMEKQIVEFESFACDKNLRRSKKKHNEWAYTINQGIHIFNDMFERTQNELRFSIKNIATYYIMKQRYNHFISVINQKYNFRNDAKEI